VAGGRVIPLWPLARAFLALSLTTFGGVSAAFPEMRRVLVDSHHWMSGAEINALFALSQASPGPNLMFVALFGFQVAGVLGAAVALTALCAPTSILAVVVEHFASRHDESRWFALARRALTPITIGLLLSTAYVLLRPIAAPPALLLTAASIVIATRTKLSPLWLIALGAALGAAGLV
jgi:chromate transporter